MPDTFVLLSTVLRPPQHPATPCHPEPVEAPLQPVEAHRDIDDTIGDARRFRAAFADALECKVRDLLADIAATVLGRELMTAPADINAIVARSIRSSYDEPILAVRVSPDDIEALGEQPLRIVPDASLRRGDVAFDVSYGTIDLSLGTRLERVLDAAR